jgi:acetyl esterase/lipase
MSLREGLVFAVHDGVELRGDLYLPDGPGPHPVLAAVPGGAWLRGDRAGLKHWGAYLAAQGFAVFSIDYRRSTAGPIFPQNVRDVAAAVRFLDAEAERLGLDRSRLGLLGASAGAHLAALATLAADTPLVGGGYPKDVGAGRPIRPRVLVTVYGVFDLVAHWRADSLKPKPPEGDVTVRMLGAEPGADPDLYHAASPTAYVATAAARPPTLVIWGDHDTDVLPAQSQAFAATLARAGVEVQTLVVEGAGHFWFSRDPIDAADGFNARVAPHLTAFLQRHLSRA